MKVKILVRKVSVLMKSPSTPQVKPGGTLQIDAEAKGGYTNLLKWSLVDVNADGTLDGKGGFTAGPTPGTVSIRVESAEDPREFQMVEVTVTNP